MSIPTEYIELQESADELVLKHSSLVKRIAYHLMNRLPQTIDVDDLIQAGMIGLLEASRNYSTDKGASFETYAGIRIRGSMLDEVRKTDWTPRSVHRKIREVTQTIRIVENESGRDARDFEVAERLDLSLEEYHKILRDAAACKLFSIDTPHSEDAVPTQVAGSFSLGPAEAMEERDIRGHLKHAIQDLPDREQLVMSLYYDDELNLREIGEILEVSESRVCQIHSQALVRLRARMDNVLSPGN